MTNPKLGAAIKILKVVLLASGLAAASLASVRAADEWEPSAKISSESGADKSFTASDDYFSHVGASDDLDDGDRDKRHLVIHPEAHAGYNQLVRGYKGYKNLGNAGVDVYMTLSDNTDREPSWRDNFVLRLSADYFPMQVPAGVYNLTEDMYSVNASFLYRFQDYYKITEDAWVPFLGAGFGEYFDRIKLDTPATGTVTGTHTSFGFNLSLGFNSPRLMGSWRLTPEVRIHAIRAPDNYYAVNTAYQLGLSARFGGKK